jgi:hypothetical protein
MFLAGSAVLAEDLYTTGIVYSKVTTVYANSFNRIFVIFIFISYIK